MNQGEGNQGANGGQNFRNHPVGSIEIIRTNEFARWSLSG